MGIWALRAQGYEASRVDSLKPREFIRSGLVDWELIGQGGLMRHRPGIVGIV